MLIGGFQPSAGARFEVLTFGSLTGSFDVIDLPAVAKGLTWDLSDLYASGTLIVTAVPEPTSVALLLLGLWCLLVRRGD